MHIKDAFRIREELVDSHVMRTRGFLIYKNIAVMGTFTANYRHYRQCHFEAQGLAGRID
jgi:hypothetical protein